MLDLGEDGGEDGGAADHGLALLAYGAFGSRELTQGSPLDLLFVFEKDHHAAGRVAELAGRFREALAGPAASGPLYDISHDSDHWGRPGPLVASLDELAALLAEDGSGSRWLALMQARVVAGPTALAGDLSRRLMELVVRSADPGRIAAGLAERRLAASAGRAAPGIWDVRRRPGGLDDLEAAVRILQLRFVADFPDIWGPSVAGALAGLADAGLMEDALVRDLLRAQHLLRQVENVMTIAMGEWRDGIDPPEALQASLSRAAGLESFAQLETAVNQAVELVQVTSRKLL
jgi:glutamate-ammonia-ligase adenylyltransferase